jgi:4-amino-4-deoxy-L-arabinose transferase-like glycosyltransferase
MSIGVRLRRRAPELLLATLAGLTFLGCLGSPEVWGKREQRAVAETLDTVEHGHWLVAHIQGRKRLEKPPLPRWMVATLVSATGQDDEWVFRLPGALAAVGMVGLSYALGKRIAGRSAGLAAGLVLTSTAFFISESRQAGNDAPLAFFVTLALYAAYRLLEAGEQDVALDAGPTAPARRVGWAWLMYTALGCGFLTKGPIAVLLFLVAVVPYLATVGRLKEGGRRLWHGPAALFFLFLALLWPVPVLLQDPGAARLWYLEMIQKTASLGIKHRQGREILALGWPGLTAPWMVLGLLAAFLPFRKDERPRHAQLWLVWWWAMGNLVMFCFWKVAKPNYYLPCLPAVAVLVGVQWVRLTQLARELDVRGLWARLTLQGHWVGFFLVGAIGPVVAWKILPAHAIGATVLGALLIAGSIGSAWAWRRGADALALAPIVGAMTVGTVLGYGMMAPREDLKRGHRALATKIERVLPDEARTIFFFGDLDEGLWFYLRDRDLVPVPQSQAEYNKGLELYEKQRRGEIKWSEAARLEDDKALLLSWLRAPDRASSFLMIKARHYDRMAADLDGVVKPLYREEGLDRNELVLLQAAPPEVVASIAPTPKLR